MKTWELEDKRKFTQAALEFREADSALGNTCNANGPDPTNLTIRALRGEGDLASLSSEAHRAGETLGNFLKLYNDLIVKGYSNEQLREISIPILENKSASPPTTGHKDTTTTPEDTDDQEIVGYDNALDLVHLKHKTTERTEAIPRHELQPEQERALQRFLQIEDTQKSILEHRVQQLEKENERLKKLLAERPPPPREQYITSWVGFEQHQRRVREQAQKIKEANDALKTKYAGAEAFPAGLAIQGIRDLSSVTDPDILLASKAHLELREVIQELVWDHGLDWHMVREEWMQALESTD